MELAQPIVCTMQKSNSRAVLGRKPKIKRLVGRPRHRQIDNVNTDLKDIGWEEVDLKHLSKKTDQWQGLVNIVMNPCLLQNAENFMAGCGTASFSGRILLYGASQLVNYTSILCFSELWPHAVCQAHTSVITQENSLCCENLKCYNCRSFTNQNIQINYHTTFLHTLLQISQISSQNKELRSPLLKMLTNCSCQQPQQ